MTHALKAALLLGALALSGCTNADRFDNPGAGSAGGQAGIDQSALGSATDPESPAYFNQTIGDRVLFAVDQSTLSPEAQAVLDGQARWLLANTDYRAVIEGHADEQGTREYNLALGARRANSVRDYLVSRGVAATRIETKSWGKEKPLAVCSDESCYSQNRRAVTVISLGATS